MEVVIPAEVKEIGLVFADPKRNPLTVVDVCHGSWADNHNIVPGNEIVKLNGRDVSEMTDKEFKSTMSKRPVNLQVKIGDEQPSASSNETDPGKENTMELAAEEVPKADVQPVKQRSKSAPPRGTQKRAPKSGRKHRAVEFGTGALNLRSELLEQSRQFTFAGAWRIMLDPKSDGQVRLAAFCEVCRELGHNRNLRELWREFDRDDRGDITLREFDGKSADILNKFHSALIEKYGTTKKVFSRLGLCGNRAIESPEFCHLVTHHKLLGQVSQEEAKEQAEELFRTLCLNEPDLVPAITPDDFTWLFSVATHLEPKLCEKENLEDSEDETENKTEDVFEKLYTTGVEKHHRRAHAHKCAQRSPSTPHTSHNHDPHVFEKLHDESRLKAEKQKLKAEQFLREVLPEKKNPKKTDKEVFERLCRPHPRLQRVESEPTLDTSFVSKPKVAKVPEIFHRLHDEHKLREERRKEAVEKAKTDLVEKMEALQKQQEEQASPKKLVGYKSDLEAVSRVRGATAEKKRPEKEMESTTAMINAPKLVPSQETFERLYSDGRRRKDAHAYEQHLLKLARETGFGNNINDIRVFERLVSSPGQTQKLQMSSPRRSPKYDVFFEDFC